MQVAAWGKMFASYARAMPWADALSTTLDPEKPCELCVGIAKAKTQNSDPLPAPESGGGVKLVFALSSDLAADEPRSVICRWRATPEPQLPENDDPVRLRPPRIKTAVA